MKILTVISIKVIRPQQEDWTFVTQYYTTHTLENLIIHVLEVKKLQHLRGNVVRVLYNEVDILPQKSATLSVIGIPGGLEVTNNIELYLSQ